MNINIKTFFATITIFILFITILFIQSVSQLNEETKKLKSIEHNRYLMTLKADELRQSSDDLSKFANKYVITAKPIYKENYFMILDIRNAKVQRPLNYEGIYWDLSLSLRNKYHPPSEKISLKEEMLELPYTSYEFELLQKSENNSNDLVNLEVEAFNTMKGLYKDKNENYTIKDIPNQQLAISLINSVAYEKAKEKIMLPIDKFLQSIKKRTDAAIIIHNEKIETLFQRVYILFGIGGFIFIIVLLLIYKKILNPISWLTDTILHFQKGDKEVRETIFYADEIGLMTKQFFAMKKKLDDDYENIKKISFIDPLTNIYNRRYFFEISEQLLKLGHRRKEPISLMMIDIDLFKKVNDTYGHLVGDEILKLLAANVQKILRESDVFSRFGGEEFIILLPNTNKLTSIKVANKIRTYIEKNHFIDNDIYVQFTISIGVTESTVDDKEINNLIKRADEALYIAKENGRNRVEAI